MQVVPGRSPGAQASAASSVFTGEVLIDPVLERTDGMAVNSVMFPPGARTYWHRHEAGQALYVTAGEGWVGTRERAVRIRVGDTVWTSPGEEHWHGAGDDTYLVHLGFTLGASEFTVEVTEEEFRRYLSLARTR
jgi:quercetin dioxygenase-like cupin family protein